MYATTATVLSVLLTLTAAAPSLLEQLPLGPLTLPARPSTSAAKPLLELHRELVEFESISGNEHNVGKYLVSYLKSIGLTVETQTVKPSAAAKASGAETFAPWILHTEEGNQEEDGGESSAKAPSRFNIYAYPGTNRTVHTLLSSHIDTVPPYIPYDISSAAYMLTDEGTISGRGSVDAKASVAAMLTAYTDLTSSATTTDEKLPSLAFLFVVDEEIGGAGMRHASDTLNTTFRTGIFGEPTQGALCCGHKGNLGFQVVVTGKAAHSGYPWLGVSANELLLTTLGAMLNADLPSSNKYGDTTVNIGRMEGGVAGNVVAEHASANVAMRLAGGTAEESREIVNKAVEAATKKLLEKGGSVELQSASAGYGPIDIDCDVAGWEGKKLTVNYGTDIPWLKGDHKRYLYGPGSILVAHSDHEALTVADLQKGVEDYKMLILATADD